MRTLKLTIAYDGTDFAGWQRQASDRTVQATIEDALLPIEGARAIVIGAGRTDAGVHAAGQVASVVLNAPIAAADLMRALNATMPQDVRIGAVDEMPDAFNAQFAATQKSYRFSIWSTGVVPPRSEYLKSANVPVSFKVSRLKVCSRSAVACCSSSLVVAAVAMSVMLTALGPS